MIITWLCAITTPPVPPSGLAEDPDRHRHNFSKLFEGKK
jgi:hypothetical protein